MKKLLILFLIIFPIFVKADDDFTNMCGFYGYSRIWGDLTPNQYTCSDGYFLPADATDCVACSDEYTCPGGTYTFNETDAQGLTKTNPNVYNFINEQNTCAANIGSNRMYAVMQPISAVCTNGQFLPANALECVACPSGYTCPGGTYYLNETTAQGLTKTNPNVYNFTNEQNTCAANIGSKNMYAIMQPISAVCTNGQFLPANALECVACPSGYTCPGGTYYLNETTAQGITKNNNENYAIVNANNTCSTNLTHHVLNAVFTVNSYTCLSGQYLPANAIECITCSTGTICPGGTYTFNETETQGITGCENGYSMQDGFCVGNTITINWSDASAEDITANNAGTMTYGGDIRTPRAAIDKTNIGLRFKGWKFTPNQQ